MTSRLFICALSLLFTYNLSAFQGQGELSGSVTDAKTGETIPGATIQILETTLGAVTNGDGFYNIKNIPAKTYSIQASFVGYETVIKYNIVIKSGGIPDLNFELKKPFQNWEK
jgi:hypothetical protein